MPKFPKFPPIVWLLAIGVVIFLASGGGKGGIHMPNLKMPNLSAGSSGNSGGYQSNPGFSHSSH